MKRAVVVFILICLFSLVCAPAFSLTSPTLDVKFKPSFKSGATADYEPYGDDEFPKWALNVRRAECIFFGGIPITLPVTMLVTNLAGADFSFLQNLGIACAVSGAITLIDYILGVINED